MAKKRKKNIKKHSSENHEQEFMGDLQLPIEEDSVSTESESSQLEHQREETVSSEVPSTQEEESPERYPEESSDELTLGQYLKTEREKRNIKITDISLSTRISTLNLELLEKDNYQSLPNKAYVRGYVKNYTKFLGIKEEHALELFDKQYPSKRTEKPAYHITKEDYSEPKELNLKLILIIGLSVLVLIGAFLLYKTFSSKDIEIKATDTQAESLEKEEVQEKVVAQSLDAQTPLEKETSAPIEQKEQETQEVSSLADNEEKTEPTEETIEPKEKKEEKDEEKINFSKVPYPLYSFDENPEALENLPSQFKNSTIKGQQNVIISAHNADTWLTHKIDDQDIKKYILKKGQYVLLRGDLVRVFLGNIGAGTVFLNEKPLILKSRSGVKSLIFPQSKAKDYVLPLFIYNKKTGGAITSEQYLKENP